MLAGAVGGAEGVGGQGPAGVRVPAEAVARGQSEAARPQPGWQREGRGRGQGRRPAHGAVRVAGEVEVLHVARPEHRAVASGPEDEVARGVALTLQRYRRHAGRYTSLLIKSHLNIITALYQSILLPGREGRRWSQPGSDSGFRPR